MSAAVTIRGAQADGVELTLSPAGTIKAIGDGAAVNRWLAVIRQHKAEIIDVLKAGAADLAPEEVNPIRQATAPLSIEQERAIRSWLALIGETDISTIVELMERCQRDADTRVYFIGRARAELPNVDSFADPYFRPCRECLHLRGDRCSIASPGAVVSANHGYRPTTINTPHRCAGFRASAKEAG